ncbi:Cthe_2314 family HEPN domain-containing protein [Pseudoalteromonas sp. SIMBA_153]
MKHSENQHVTRLLPLVAEYLQSGLEGVINEAETFHATERQKYAHDVCSRVFEIDNAFENLELSIEYLKRATFSDSNFDFTSHHSFHFENFLLRLTSVIDRCYLLAGSTVLLANETIEKLGGNRKVTKELADISPNAVEIIKKLEKEVESLRPLRNQVAHNNGYSNKNLLAVRVIESSEGDIKKQFSEILPVDTLKDIVINDSVSLFEPVITNVNMLVDHLLNELAEIYTKITKTNT